MLYYEKHLKSYAQRLRSNMTISEIRLWSRLRGKQLLAIQFYRQKPIGKYIVDFYAPQIQLVIELDGSQHLNPIQAQNDVERDSYLNGIGLTVLRFNNLQVLRETNGVLETIFQQALAKLERNPPDPLLAKGGAKSP